ncbi:MAG: MATE family efflux transporter [Actinobacteria bacterium]|nr:MATE family efflux transporter [Actinomycetota bacterium]
MGVRRPDVLRPDPSDRELWRLTVPAFGSLVAEPLYVLVDTAVVGHLGTEELGGLALASAILLTGYAVFIFLAYGTTAAVARLLGAGEQRRAAEQAIQGLWLAAGLGVVLALAGVLGGRSLIALLGGRDEIAAHAWTYLSISLVGVPALLVGLAGVGYLRGLRDTRTPLVLAVGTAVGNGVLEVVLIFGFGYGIGASALATVVAQTVAASVFAARVVGAARRHGAPLGPQLGAIRRLLVVGVHLLVRTAALRGSLLAGVAVAAGLGGAELAAYEIGFQLWTLGALALDAVAIAAQTVVGGALGAGDAVAARRLAARAILWSTLAGGVLGGALAVGRGVLPGVFTPDPDVAALLAGTLVLVALAQPLNGVVFALDGILIGAGDQRYVAGAMAVAFAAFLPAAYAVGQGRGGLAGLWAALLWFMVVRALGLGLRFRGDRWAVVGAVR